MKFTIPEKMPSRHDFMIMFMDAIFPDIEEDLNYSRTGYGYTSACAYGAKETGLIGNDFTDLTVEEDSNIFRLMFEMGKNCEIIFNETSNLLEGEAYKNYSSTLFSFCDTSSCIVRNWVNENSPRNRVNLNFEAALFLSYLLLSRSKSSANRKAFFEKCLAYVGITDIEENILNKLYDFNWDELGAQGTIGAKTFTRLENKAIILLGTVVFTIIKMIGIYSLERHQPKLEKLHAMFEELFEKDVKAYKAMESAELAFFNSNKFFDPRSIQTPKKMYPQDFFVLPEFELNGEKNVTPLSAIHTAKKSQRLMIVAKTGLGKSAYLQMASLCMLYDRCGTEESKRPALQKISEELNAPEDMFIISVPARMFSKCYSDARYKEWTTDFVTLFFNCMWKLSDGMNFYSTQNAQRFIANKAPQTNNDFSVTDELLDYLKVLARSGKLLLVLDSFDEISSGDMRASYLKTLAAFYDKYCFYPEANEVGAHIIVSSRELSPKTMENLELALEIEPKFSKYCICPLNHKQREALIFKWNRFFDITDEESRERIEQIENNHYYLDYSVNPYMLSVVCAYFTRGLDDITQNFISTLVEKMRKNNKYSDDFIIQDVLMNIVKILQDIAGETVTEGNPHFSRRKLNKYLYNAIDKTDLTESDIESYIERLHEIFVTDVGLIVPADGADNDYQFINSQIRFELAAKGIQHALEQDEKPTVYRDVILPSITKIEDYVGFLVPLLCSIDLENVQLAELLVSDLVMYDFNTDEEEFILIRTMLDLLLNRYGNNIAIAANPGFKDAKYVRRAQRLLLMRVFTSKCFSAFEKEKEELLSSPAYTKNTSWFSDDV